jgi:hypothetical protein
MYNRHQVYKACLFAVAKGETLTSFGNVCGSSNQGEWQTPFYQNIAGKYLTQCENLTEQQCWALYTKKIANAL